MYTCTLHHLHATILLHCTPSSFLTAASSARTVTTHSFESVSVESDSDDSSDVKMKLLMSVIHCILQRLSLKANIVPSYLKCDKHEEGSTN